MTSRTVQSPVIPLAGLPPEQADIRNRSLPPDNKWRDFAMDEVEQTIPERLAQIVALYPQHVAVKDPAHAYTYAELDGAANQVAHAVLRSAGHGREPVPCLFHVDAERTPAIHGILRAGKPAVPLDAADAPDRLAWLIQDTGAQALVTGHESIALAETVAPSGCSVVDLDMALAEYAADPVLIPNSPDDIAAIIYTSGSTGRPKGTVNDHRAILSRLRSHILYDLCAPGVRITTIGLRTGDFAYPLAGATYCPFPIRDEGLHAYSRWLADEQITRISAVASGFRQFLDILQPDQTFPMVRSIRITSEPAIGADIPAIARAFPNSILIHAYTLSEGGWITCHYIDPHAPLGDQPLPIGYAVEDKEVWLEDEAGMRIPVGMHVKADRIGEIIVGGRTLADTYWKRPDLTAQVFHNDAKGSRRIYATGDLGRFRSDGALVHLGRKDLQLKIRGHRVEIGEPEAAMRGLPTVKDVAVSDWTDDRGERYLAAYVVPVSPDVTVASLREAVAGLLPDYMTPRAFLLLNKLPRLYNGKVDRRALPEPDHVRPELATPYVAPSTPLETRLVDIWAEVLELDRVGVDDRFTDLGGHSLAAVRLLAALDEFTDQELPFSVMLEAGTVRELARVLQDGEWTPQWISLVQVQPGDGRPPLFVVPAAASTSLTLVPFAAEMGVEQGVFGFDPLGMSSDTEPHDTVDAIAAHYIREMREFRPEGPYLLGGRCFGALVAIEMAYQLEGQGASVPLVAVLDSGALRVRTVKHELERPRMRWRQRRQRNAPLTILRQSLTYRTRKAYRRLRRGSLFTPHTLAPTNPVRQAHRQAGRRYRACPVHSRLVVYMSEEYASNWFNLEWRAIAAGEYVEEVCDRWSHVGFLDDTENLRHVCNHLRGELEIVKTVLAQSADAAAASG